ncbi:MAG: LysR family transcriptional regulator [Polyangiaceae bacterium]
MDSFAGVRVSDLVTFLGVQRTRSVSAAARELKVTPSQVSKAIARLEARLGKRLFTRSARGVSLTDAGTEVLPSISAAIEAMRKLRSAGQRATSPVELTLAGPSYLVTHLAAAIAATHPRLHLRGLELMPGVIRASFTENSFDLAFVAGATPLLPAGWSADCVGHIRAALYGAPALARQLGSRRVTPELVRMLPFVVPLFSPRHFSIADDGCPLAVGERRAEQHMQTVGSALEMAAATGKHVVFAPALAARRFLRARTLVEIPVDEWNVVEPLMLICSVDRVLERERKAIRDALSKIPELGVAPPSRHPA